MYKSITQQKKRAEDMSRLFKEKEIQRSLKLTVNFLETLRVDPTPEPPMLYVWGGTKVYVF